MTTETGGLVIDTGRLARAVHLDATRVGSGRCYQITGGAHTHVVDLDDEDGRLCDCEDHLWRNMTCKHILACRLREGDGQVIAALRQLLPYPSRRSARRHRHPDRPETLVSGVGAADTSNTARDVAPRRAFSGDQRVLSS